MVNLDVGGGVAEILIRRKDAGHSLFLLVI